MQINKKKEYEPFRWQIVAILINFAPRPKTIEHSTSLFCFQNSLQPWIFTMAGLTLKASPLEKIFFGTHLEHRMRLHIGKRHCDKWIVHHCKPKDGGWQEKIQETKHHEEKQRSKKAIKRKRHNTNSNTRIIQDIGFQLDTWLFKNLQIQ